MNVAQSSLYFMDLAAKSLGWILQVGKMIPIGLTGEVKAMFILEESIIYQLFQSQLLFQMKRVFEIVD